jgi:hypothetical protein
MEGECGRRGSESRRRWVCELLAVTWWDWAVEPPAGRKGTLERGEAVKFVLRRRGAERFALKYWALVVVGIGLLVPCVGAPDS